MATSGVILFNEYFELVEDPGVNVYYRWDFIGKLNKQKKCTGDYSW
jgi:hypothetical protein